MRIKYTFYNPNDEAVVIETSHMVSSQWEYSRNGGCGNGRFLMSHNLDNDDLIHTAPKKSNIAVDIKGTSGDWERRYNGYLSQSRRIKDNGKELVEIETVGYKEQLNRQVITVEPTYGSATIKDLFKGLWTDYISGNSTITCDDADIFGDFVPDAFRLVGMTVLEAMELFAITQGGVEWGVNSARGLYLKESSSVIGQLEIGHKDNRYVEHAQVFDPLTNFIRLYGGFLSTGHHYERTGNDPTAIYACGLREYRMCEPAIITNSVADRFITNLLTVLAYPQVFVAYNRHLTHFDWLEYKQPLDKVKTFFNGISTIVNADLVINAVTYRITGNKNYQMVELGNIVNNIRGLQSYV